MLSTPPTKLYFFQQRSGDAEICLNLQPTDKHLQTLKKVLCVRIILGCCGFCFAINVSLQSYIFELSFTQSIRCIETVTDIMLLLPLLVTC